jgi:hypothetical protein
LTIPARTYDTPDKGAKPPVPIPIRATTTNNVDAETLLKGRNIRRTTNNEKMFIRIVVFSGPIHRSASQGGILLPIMAYVRHRCQSVANNSDFVAGGREAQQNGRQD